MSRTRAPLSENGINARGRPEPLSKMKPYGVPGRDQGVAAYETGDDFIRLRFVDDLPYDELAGELGTTPAAARVRVHRGLSALRLRLDTSKESTR